jgi:hypothetical protein
VVVDQLLEETELDDVVEELPDATPRFVVISFELNHDDGRKNYPLIGTRDRYPFLTFTYHHKNRNILLSRLNIRQESNALRFSQKRMLPNNRYC